MKLRVSVVVVLGLLAAACAQQPVPAPVTGWNDTRSGAAGGAILVERGDTLYGLAHRYNIPPRQLIDANHLVPPYRLEVGQRLATGGARPAASSYAAYAANRPAPPAYRGGRWGQAEPVTSSQQIAAAPVAGDTPRIDSAEVPRSDRPPLARTRPPERPAAVQNAAAVSGPSAAMRDAPAPSQTGVRGFIWPVRGQIVEPYGPNGNGTQNDGINIAARVGTPVYAAAAGEVVYVGNELRGYGNLVLIKHEGGYLTAYAHNSTLLVHKGDRVTRGQVIARVGATGEVGSPQLHFEIRMGRNPVDPMRYLPVQQAAAIGE